MVGLIVLLLLESLVIFVARFLIYNLFNIARSGGIKSWRESLVWTILLCVFSGCLVFPLRFLV